MKAKFEAGQAVTVDGWCATIVYALDGSTDGDGQVFEPAYRCRIINLAGPDMFVTALEGRIEAR